MLKHILNGTTTDYAIAEDGTIIAQKAGDDVLYFECKEIYHDVPELRDYALMWFRKNWKGKR